MLTKFELVMGIKLFPLLKGYNEKTMYNKIIELYKNKEIEECNNCFWILYNSTYDWNIKASCIQFTTLIKENVY